MHRALAALLLIALLALPAGASTDAEPAAPFLVGIASRSVAPTEPVCLGGYAVFCARPHAGIKDDPLAQATAITDAATGDRIILARLTSFGSFAAYGIELGPVGIDDMRARIATATGTPTAHIVVASDHSHAGPDTIGIAGGATAAQLQQIADGVVDAAISAVADAQPAVLSWAAVDGPPLQSAYQRPPTDDTATDNVFRALFAHSPDGEPIATLANYSAHATVCGKCDDLLSGDWPAWAAQEVPDVVGGEGMAMVGAIGATDWRKADGPIAAKEAEARTRLRSLLATALRTRTPVVGTRVEGRSTRVFEQLTAPAYALTYGPSNLPAQAGEFTIDRSPLPPHIQGTVIGTYAGALRVGDVFFSTFAGEPFPQNHTALVEGVEGPGVHFTLGAAQDFLGYMAADDAGYRQTAEEGATSLAGCPEESVLDAAGATYDGACTGHWTLQVSPTIGRHSVCTIQDAAERLGFTATGRSSTCGALTTTDITLDG